MDIINKIVYNFDGTQMASCSKDKTIRLWDTKTLKCVESLVGHTSDVVSIVYNSVERQIVSGSHDKTIKIWDTKTFECLSTFNICDLHIRLILYSSNGNYLTSYSSDMNMKKLNILRVGTFRFKFEN